MMMRASSTAVETNGIGRKTTAHLNLTRSLADVGWLDDDNPTRGQDIREPTAKKWDRETLRSTLHRYAGVER